MRSGRDRWVLCVVFQFQRDQPAEVVQQEGVLHRVAAGVRQQGNVAGPGDGHLGRLFTGTFGMGGAPPGGLPALGHDGTAARPSTVGASQGHGDWREFVRN